MVGAIFCKFQQYFNISENVNILFSFVDHIYCAPCKDDAIGGGCGTAHLDNVNESAASPTIITALFKC